MADHGFVGADRHVVSTAAKETLDRQRLGEITCDGARRVRVDGADLRRVDPRINQRFAHGSVSPRAIRIGRHNVVGVRGDP